MNSIPNDCKCFHLPNSPPGTYKANSSRYHPYREELSSYRLGATDFELLLTDPESVVLPLDEPQGAQLVIILTPLSTFVQGFGGFFAGKFMVTDHNLIRTTSP